MRITTDMIAVDCLIEDNLVGQPLCTRGLQPTMRDSEAFTSGVGGFLGLTTESSIFTHFCRDNANWFSGLHQITQTTFTRQAANLWKVKQDLWQKLAHCIPQDHYLSIVDSFPARSVASREPRILARFGKRQPMTLYSVVPFTPLPTGAIACWSFRRHG